jgi:hypothetical protein
VAWRWVMTFLVVGLLACLAIGVPLLWSLVLLLAALLLFACRGAFAGAVDGRLWPLPGWVLMLLVTLASGFWLLGRMSGRLPL